MSAVHYKNTCTNIPGWVDTVHEKNPIGYAYHYNGFNVQIYGSDYGLFTLSQGLTVSERCETPLGDWVAQVSGASGVKDSIYDVGSVVGGVWRPGLYFQDQINQALFIDPHKHTSAEQVLRILLSKLDEIFLYIEPDENGLNAFGHKTRELLILACTEVENFWLEFMQIANAQPRNRFFTTNDYVRLLSPLYLAEYIVELTPYRAIGSLKPFVGWSESSPTESLRWYGAYNKTKHDRNNNFSDAKLIYCIEAIAAYIILHCVRYGPFRLFQSQSVLSGIINQLFNIRLDSPDPSTFYVAKMDFDGVRREGLCCGEGKGNVVPWVIGDLSI